MKAKSESEVAQSCPTLSDPWTAAFQAPPSMGFARQEYWSGVPLPSLKRQSIVYFYRSENTLYDPVKTDPCYCIFGPTYRIQTARMDYKVKYGLWMIMMCQCRFISCNRWTTLLEGIDNGW